MTINMSNTFKINSDDKVFIDTNILVFLFSPDFVHSKKSQIDRYSSVFEKSIEKKENYEIFLIEISSKDCKNNNIKKIIKYDELKELEFIPNKYEVHYILKNKG